MGRPTTILLPHVKSRAKGDVNLRDLIR